MLSSPSPLSPRPLQWALAALLLACGGGPTASLEPAAPPEAIEEADPAEFEMSASLAAPSFTEVVAGSGEVRLAWSAGESPVESFQLRFRAQGGAWDYRSSLGKATTHVVSGLNNGQSYDFQVRIKGKLATTTSAYSATRSATPVAGAPVEPGGDCSDVAARHITVAGAGGRDGKTLASAGTLADLSDLVAAVGPGGRVCIHAGTYRSGHSVSRGGSAGKPVIIQGVGGRPVFESTFEASTRAKSGATVFKVQASHLTFENLEFRHVGTCFAFGSTADVQGVTLRGFRAENLATCVDIARSSEARVANLTVEDAMILQFTRGGIFLTSHASGVKLDRVYIDMQPEKIGGQGSDYPVGIALYDSVRDVLVQRTTVLNVVGQKTGYTQGDGIDGEQTAQDIIVEDSYFRGSQDGCVDTKARNMLIRNTVAVGCKRNFRLWQYATPGPRVEGVSSYQPSDAHFFMHSGQTTARDIAVRSSNSAKLVAYDCSGTCTFDVDGMKGTLADPSRLNAASVRNSSLVYGQAVTLPAIPNPTQFQP